MKKLHRSKTKAIKKWVKWAKKHHKLFKDVKVIKVKRAKSPLADLKFIDNGFWVTPRSLLPDEQQFIVSHEYLHQLYGQENKL